MKRLQWKTAQGCSAGFSNTLIRSLTHLSDSQAAAVSCAVSKEQVTFPLCCGPHYSCSNPSHTVRTDQNNTLCMGLQLWGHSETWVVCLLNRGTHKWRIRTTEVRTSNVKTNPNTPSVSCGFCSLFCWKLVMCQAMYKNNFNVLSKVHNKSFLYTR